MSSLEEERLAVKRTFLALSIGTVVFGAIYAMAASLGVSTNTLGAGNSAVAACQSGTLTASYATTYDSTIPAYKVGVVTVSGLQSGCYSKSFKVTLTGPGASNASLSEVTGTAPSSGSTFTADFTSNNVSAANVTGVHVVITG